MRFNDSNSNDNGNRWVRSAEKDSNNLNFQPIQEAHLSFDGTGSSRIIMSGETTTQPTEK